jgi:1,4-alpha-glucan branching enzyme
MYEKGREKNSVRFSFKPGNRARAVAVAGDFSDWKPITMRKTPNGRFVRNVTGLPARCEYKFFIDGDWTHDPENEKVVRNSYGSLNSVAEV